MKIAVDRLFQPDTEAIEVDAPLRPSGDLADRYPAGVRVVARVTPIAHGVHMTGSLTGTEHETCSRCLERFERPIRIQVEETFSEDAGHEPDFYSAVAPLVDRRIDLSDLVSQLLEVDEPMAAVCSPSCRGLCAGCGANRNAGDCGCEAHSVDARLAGLARLRDEMLADDNNGR